jgi:putative transposase
MLIRKAYKYRLYPNQVQQEALRVQFGHTRFVYNYFLALRIATYQQTGKGLRYADTAKLLPGMKRDPQYAWLKEADSQVLQQALKDLERAYQNFYEKRAGYPRYKSKHDRQSIRYPQRVKVDLEAHRTYLPKVGWVKTVFHRAMEGKLKNVVVSKTKSSRYYASFQVEVDIPEPECCGEGIGLDLGLMHYAVLSDGTKIPNPRHLKQSEKGLARLQRRLSRRQKGSKGRQKARMQVSRMQEKIANQRKDFQHKLSHRLVKEYGLIGVESLHVKGMMQNGRLARHIADAAWGEFNRQLAYKGAWYGCQVKKIGQWYPSSKTCSVCGTVKAEMTLSIRNWECAACQAGHDRDVNAARNILYQATVGTTGINAGGVPVRPVFQMQAGTLKPEAPQQAAGWFTVLRETARNLPKPGFEYSWISYNPCQTTR